MKNVTISRETFATLLSLSKAASSSFEDRLKNAQSHLLDSPASGHWKDSVAFWERQFKEANGIYQKAVEESIYS